MYSQGQRFIATILLFSLLLQSCGNPNWKLLDDEGRKTSAKTSKSPKLVQKQEDTPKVYSEWSDELPAERFIEALAEVSSEPVRRSVLPAPPQRTPSSSPSRSPRPSTRIKEPTKRIANTPRHVVLAQESIARRVDRKANQVSNASTPKPAMPLITTSPAEASQPSTQVGSPSPKVAITPKDPTLIGPYSLPGGDSVSFSQLDGQWKAAITTAHPGLSRTETLPVLCEGAIGEALRGLEVMDLVRTRSHIQILKTDQPPWTPRVVYIGELGLKGGGNGSSSSSRCAYPYEIDVRYNSDSEYSDNFVYTSGYQFYHASNGKWTTSSTYYVRSNERLSLSANDIRASSWSRHSCSMGCGDCLTLNTSYHSILSERSRREERRREKRRQEQEEARKRTEKKRHEEEAQQRIADRQALAKKVAAQAVEEATSAEGFSKFWNESSVIQTQQVHLLRALQHVGHQKISHQALKQETIAVPNTEALQLLDPPIPTRPIAVHSNGLSEADSEETTSTMEQFSKEAKYEETDKSIVAPAHLLQSQAREYSQQTSASRNVWCEQHYATENFLYMWEQHLASAGTSPEGQVLASALQAQLGQLANATQAWQGQIDAWEKSLDKWNRELAIQGVSTQQVREERTFLEDATREVARAQEETHALIDRVQHSLATTPTEAVVSVDQHAHDKQQQNNGLRLLHTPKADEEFTKNFIANRLELEDKEYATDPDDGYNSDDSWATTSDEEPLGYVSPHAPWYASNEEDTDTPLHQAAERGDLEAVASILEAAGGSVLEDRGKFKETPLHKAAKEGHTQIVSLLLNKGAGIHARNGCEATPLHLATSKGHADTACLLVCRGADLAAKDKFRSTPLHWARASLKQTVEEAISHRCVQFIATYSQTLPPEGQAYFTSTMAPLLEEKLVRADPAVQQSLLLYWEHGGSFYPFVLQNEPVEYWLSQSLCLDLAQEALVTGNTTLRGRFMQAVSSLQQHTEGPALGQLLLALQAKQQAYQLDLLSLCKVMELLPADGERACHLLNDASNSWLVAIRKNWLKPHLEDFTDQYSEDEFLDLCTVLSHLPWDARLTTDFLAAIKEKQDFQALQSFLIFLAQHPVTDAIFQELLLRDPPEGGGSPCKTWHHALACEVLHGLLSGLFADQGSTVHAQLAALLDTHLDAYNSLAYFLSALQQTEAIPTERAAQVQQLGEVLGLLDAYQVPTEVYASAFQTMSSLPASQWEGAVHQVIVAATFHASHERSVQEAIESIAKNAPGVFFAGDSQQLQSSYDALMVAYEGHSGVLNERQPIAHWSKETITRWAKLVKDQNVQVSQSELLAVIKRVVELHHGFPPRSTQLLSVLTLLNSARNTGRLAQINTGEGKSLTVAMLAALYALQGQKVDVLTTSTELSIPEVAKQTPFFTTLGLAVGENSATNNGDDEAKHTVYQKDIVYGTAEDFQGDILRTEFFRRKIRGDRGFGVVLVDEVDSMLFDDRSHSIRLSSQMPAMNHLEIIYGTAWNQVNQIASRLRTIAGKCYFITAKFQDVEGGVLLPEGQDLASCSVLVEDQGAFLKEHTTSYLEKLLRKLTPEARENLEAYQALNLRVEELNDDIEQGKSKGYSKEWITQQEKEREGVYQALKEAAWHQELEDKGEYLAVPVHLQAFAREQIPHWVECALYALFFYHKGQHYDVKGGKIVPVDYNNTGVLQFNTVWDNGLAQFLQMKEGLKIVPENVSTNFISKTGYFKRYGHKLYGLTGTLGNPTTRSFLSEIYGVDMVTIPPYKHREIMGNSDSRYLCKELPAQLLSTPEAWYDTVANSVLRAARNGQAVLVICKYINQVEYLQAQLATNYDAEKLFTYTGQEQFSKTAMEAGEILIATNIAGRGTDLTTSEEVEANGGLHVCITFLPENYRVELQNAGRTARQGKKGTAQLVMLHKEGAATIQALRAQRDQKEAQSFEKARQEIAHMHCSDRLFMRYCGLEALLFPVLEALSKVRLSQTLFALWKIHAEAVLTPPNVRLRYEALIQQTTQAHLHQTPDPESWKAYTSEERSEARGVLAQEIQAAFVQALPLAKFYKRCEEEARINFICAQQAQQEISADVLEAFYNDKLYVPQGGDLAVQYGWGEAERHGTQESWGLWLKKQGASGLEEATLHTRFDSFEKGIQAAAQADQLIENAYYHVEKGNEYLRGGMYSFAIKAYDRAIALDPRYSVNARFNKGQALLTPKKNKHNHEAARGELTTAKYLIRTYYKPTLLTLDTLVGQTGQKPRTSEHVQHQLDILSQQENYIQAALDVIEKAQEENWDIEITGTKSLKEIFEKAEGNRFQAIEEAACNGFTHVFTIKEKEPTPWWSILAVALIGLAQITVGVLLMTCTLGSALMVAKGFISEGISDLITSVKAGIQGSFSWAEWGLQKVISLAVSLVSAGWNAIQNGCKAIKEAVQNLSRVTVEMGKEGMKLAMQRVGLELGRGVAKECVNTLVNYGVDKLVAENIEKKIAAAVTEQVTHSLEQSAWVQVALSIDVSNKDSHWQNLLQQEGLALLALQKDSKLVYALQEIAKGVASNKIKGAQAMLQSTAMLKAMDEVMAFTNNFLANFHQTVAEKYKKEIKEAEQAQQEKAKKQEEKQQQGDVQVVSAPPIDEADLVVPPIEMQADYKSDLRGYYYEALSSSSSLCSAFSDTITSRMTRKIQGSMLRPVTGSLVSMGIDKMLEGVTKSLEKKEAYYCSEGAVYYHSNHVGNESLKKPEAKECDKGCAQQASVKEDKATAQGQSQPLEGMHKPAQPISPENEAMAQETRGGAEAGIPQIGAAAAELGQPFAIYNEYGQLMEIIGRKQPGKLIKLQHFPSEDGIYGHWQPYGTDAQAKLSGPTNCFYDAAACQTDKVGSGVALREQVADRLATSVHATLLYEATKRLEAANAGALRRGGKVLEWGHPKYWYYKAKGDAANAQRVKDRCEQIEDELVGVYYATGGFGNSLANNFSLNLIPRSHFSNPSFVQGQQAGDMTSFLLGAGEVFMGDNIMIGSRASLVLSGGGAVPIVGPTALAGITLTSHGTAMMTKVALEQDMQQHKAVGKTSGKNEKHTNKHAQAKANEYLEEARKAKKELLKSPLTQVKREKITKLDKQIKHFQKKAQCKGEAHSRTRKEN